MNTPEEIARKWADRIFSGARIRPDAALLISTPDCILKAAAEMVQETGAKELIERMLEDLPRREWPVHEPTLTRLREITKHGETKP